MRLNEWQLAVEAYLLNEQVRAQPELLGSLLGSPALSAEDGLAIYHNAYRARLQETLRGDYPALLAWLGDEQFERLVARYLQAQPSVHYSLRWLGAQLAAFVEGYLHPEQAAPLAELARLEWAFTLAFDAAPGSPLTLPAMASLAPEEWPELRVQLLPSVQWLPHTYNSLAMWRAAKAEEPLPSSDHLRSTQVCLVWRHELHGQFRTLMSDEAVALDGMARQGWSFAELCEHLSPMGEGAPAQAAGWLKQWLSEGLLQRR